MEYSAIDLHMRYSQIRIVDADGAVLREQRVSTTPARLVETFGGHGAMRILLETGTESEWVAQTLEAAGHEVIVADPNYAPMYGEIRRKVEVLLSYADRFPPFSKDLFLVRQTASEYLPRTINAYLALPPQAQR